MRFPIPERLKARHVALFVAFVFVGQTAEGTDFLFAILTAVYNILWAIAFNFAGGMQYPSGAFILTNGLYSVVLGLSSKVLLGQPGQRNLQAPITTMLCYCVGMLIILLVAFVVRSLRPERPLIRDFGSLQQLKQASIVCLIAGILIILATGLGSVSEGSILSALHQIGGFSLMSIVLATSYEIKHSNGRRSINWVTAVNLAIYIFYTLVYFGKTSILIGFVAWVITAILQGYDFKKGQLVGMAAGAFFMIYYIVPYSQYVRNQKSGTGAIAENIPVAVRYLSNLNETRRLYYESLTTIQVREEAHLYDNREGFLDRLIIIAPDDELIHYTDEGHVFGVTPTISAFANVIPRVLWRNKPSLNIGNAYAHELGDVLAEDDDTTGIAFSATADSFHQLSWLGILTILPLTLFLCFIIFDTVAGSSRYSAFGMLSVINMFNIGGQSGIETVVHEASYGLISLLVIAWTCKVVGPFILNTIKRQAAPPSLGQARPQPVARPVTSRI